jgi:hypothetical protein
MQLTPLLNYEPATSPNPALCAHGPRYTPACRRSPNRSAASPEARVIGRLVSGVVTLAIKARAGLGILRNGVRVDLSRKGVSRFIHISAISINRL